MRQLCIWISPLHVSLSPASRTTISSRLPPSRHSQIKFHLLSIRRPSHWERRSVMISLSPWWSHHTSHITRHMLYPISVTSVTLWPLHAATGLRALKVAWSMPPTMLLMSDIRQNIGATKIKHLTSRRRRNASHDCKTYERHKNVINVYYDNIFLPWIIIGSSA